MRRKFSKLSIALMIIITTFLFSVSNALCGSIPQLINYSGSLADAGGQLVADGSYKLTFRIYDASTGGNALWTETWDQSTSLVMVAGGSFNAMLGSHTEIPTSFFSDHPVTFLGITVDTDSEMLPRQRITSVGYAFTAGDGVPSGGIIMWKGSIEDIPEGWVLCDGNNRTPNLMDRFVIGAGGSYSISDTGGEKDHTLTIAEMPSHTHIQNPHNHGIQNSENSIDHDDEAHFKRVGGNLYDVATSNTTATNQNTGGEAAHNNLPPYYALAYIMKL